MERISMDIDLTDGEKLSIVDVQCFTHSPDAVTIYLLNRIIVTIPDDIVDCISWNTTETEEVVGLVANDAANPCLDVDTNPFLMDRFTGRS